MKKFLIIGNINAITYKEVFQLIKENKMWFGQNTKGDTRKGNSLSFNTTNGGTKTFGNIGWYTNLTHPKRNEEIYLYKTYNETDYPKYDNYDAIEVSKTAEIPMDYDGVMGVPITFLDKYCPTQFEIVGLTSSSKENTYGQLLEDTTTRAMICGNKKYARILIKKCV